MKYIQYDKEKNMKKLLKWGLLIFAGLIIIGVVSGGDTKKVGENSGLPLPSIESKSEDKVYSVGDQVKMGDIILTVNDVKVSGGSQFSKPSEGNKWINMNITLENTGSDQEYITTMGQMYLVDADGNQYSIAVTDKLLESPNNSLDGAVVAKAKKTGWVGFEAPKATKELTYRYNASFWNDKAILVKLPTQ